MARRRKYEIGVQKSLTGFAGYVYAKILHYGKLEKSKLCVKLNVVVRNWMNRSETAREQNDGSFFVKEQNEIVPNLPYPVTTEMKAKTPLFRGGSDPFLKYVVGIEEEE
eukprot:gb/GEZJ01008940.1/.p1 GENE.gb/GEZJ01008940.1/~~gb/GEZJ01008940.1/.p1  ORF type:complete len:109 (-),score=12.70 gb/GEZJ01008940.1/:40-366(-)